VNTEISPSLTSGKVRRDSRVFLLARERRSIEVMVPFSFLLPGSWLLAGQKQGSFLSSLSEGEEEGGSGPYTLPPLFAYHLARVARGFFFFLFPPLIPS